MTEKNKQTIAYAIEQIKKISVPLERLEKALQDVEDLSYGGLSSEEVYQAETLRKVYDNLYKITGYIDQLNKDVVVEGYLVKNDIKRYEVDGWELTSGSPVEVWIDYDEDDVNEWNYPPGRYVYSRIEHNGEDYYIVSLGRETKIEGKKVRIKR